VDLALSRGNRGLPKGSSLAKLLLERRGKRHPHFLRRLTVPLIPQWADAHHRRTGPWPAARSGRIVGLPDETWSGIEHKLQDGGRGLRGGSSIAGPTRRGSCDRRANHGPRKTKPCRFPASTPAGERQVVRTVATRAWQRRVALPDMEMGASKPDEAVVRLKP
jgi:hypothetical protein